ncbi:MAG: hypothetical protein D6784_17650 [Chloroflexi bacterium]|nr:MAG: hypothetical protein D6784_17650 [Chloroflexota bacterium]
MSNVTPFRYGKPIEDPAYFIGHRREMEQIYSRLLSASESSSVVGERRMGKTSLLKLLGHPQFLAEYSIDPEQYIFVYQDFGFLEGSTMPTRFWQRVLKAIRRSVKQHQDIVDEIAEAAKLDTIDNYTLDDIFSVIDDEGLTIVLLLDEFENVTRNKNFDNDFFAGLRALAIHHNLALVTSSREDLIELTHSEEVRSSPFFNIFASIRLRPFSRQEALALIDTYLADTGVRFTDEENELIFSLAGYHPYFLQMTSHHLFSAYQQGMSAEERRQHVLSRTHDEAEPMLLDYWQNSTDSQKILLTVMALRAMERDVGRDSLKEASTTGSKPVAGDTIECLERFYVRAEAAVHDLLDRGLVVNRDDEGYKLFSSELGHMVASKIVGDTEDLRGWRNWQKEETLLGVLPTDVQGLIGELVRYLNPDYRQLFGNWLLEPVTAKNTLKLLQNFLDYYEDYRAGTKLPGRPPADKVDWSTTVEALDQQQKEQLILSLKKQIVQHTGNLNKLKEEAATYGSPSSAPLKLQNDIDAIETALAELEEELSLLEQSPAA